MTVTSSDAIAALEAAKAKVIAEFGDWTNHNMRLADGCYTIAPTPTPSEPKLRRMTQIVMDWCGGSVEGLRILDLACLEGMYGLELAMQGAQVVGIEGREANLAKARFVKDTLGLSNIDFYCDDVRNLSVERYGQFDVVLCLGIYYHLDAPDVFRFMEQIGSVCTKLAIVDTHVSRTAETQHPYAGLELSGCRYVEHAPEASTDDRLKILWASLDNDYSFWLTRPSLFNLMQHCGFTSIYECHSPLVEKFEQLRRSGTGDRATFVAFKGRPVALKSSDLSNDSRPLPWPEIPR